MKMKEMFKKVEIYNEVADLMGTQKAKIQFGEKWHSERFDNYNDFSKYIRREYIKEVADQILSSDAFKIDGEIEIQYGEGIFASTSNFFSELVSNY